MMSDAMTQTIAAAAPPETLLPCPDWCTTHDGVTHCSDWRTWESGDTPRFEFQMVRHDMDERDGRIDIGQVDFTVRVVPSECCGIDNDGAPVDGFLTSNEMRAFARWLLALADVADPHGLNGEPLEWHTPHRRPLLGARAPQKTGNTPKRTPDIEFWVGGSAPFGC